MTDPRLGLFLSHSTGAFLILPTSPALWTQGSYSFFCALDLRSVCLSVIMIQIICRTTRKPMATVFPSAEVGNRWAHLPSAESSLVFTVSMLLHTDSWQQSTSLPPLQKVRGPSYTLRAAITVQTEERKSEGRVPKLGSRPTGCRVYFFTNLVCFFINKL